MTEHLRNQLRGIVLQEMEQDPAHDVAHLDRVWRNAKSIAEEEQNADMRVLAAAAYLHDLVNLPKDAPNRAHASRLSAEKAGTILTAHGFTVFEVSAAEHAILAHSYSAGIQPETIEAQILRDADRIDALGAIGIARTFSVSGALNRPLYHPEDPFAERRSLEDKTWSLDHWSEKLLRLPATMLTRGGRRLAQQRAQTMLTYLTAFADEIDVKVPSDWTALVN
ncbi:MAG: HD domain-containing protein [Paracoccaceae bacterium]